MAATNKADLLDMTQKEFAKLTTLIQGLDRATAFIKVDGVSIKDVIGHRAYWITLFMGWYQDGRAGREVNIPAKGYKWNELNAFNAKLREMQAPLDWDDVQLLLKDAYRDLIELIENLSDVDLYGAPMVGGNGKWTTGRFAEAAGASHFRSASKFIRQVVKANPR